MEAVAEAERNEYPLDCVADFAENTVSERHISAEAEHAVRPAEV